MKSPTSESVFFLEKNRLKHLNKEGGSHGRKRKKTRNVRETARSKGLKC